MSEYNGLDLTLYVRSLRPRQGNERQRTVIDRLKTLERVQAIDDYSVVVWGRQLPATIEKTQTSFGKQLLEQVETFEEWARRNGYSTENTFPIREIETRFTGELLTARLLPQLTLAEFQGDTLTFVTPVAREQDAPSVEDRLDAIENGDPYPETLVTVERARSAFQRRTIEH